MTVSASPVSASPVHVDGALDPQLSRGLWLVKWVLAIPHAIALVLLWAAFAVLSVVAFFAILFTGRYPRAIFDFNVGVLRWTWRVAFYAYGALGTDRYPPFTLDDVPDYPARLRVDYPQHLSRGLVLVKWWLLALPHYLVLGVFLGGGAWVAGQTGETEQPWAMGTGLVGLLVLIAGIALLFTGRYPRPIFDFVLGMNRWALRVAAYAALMSDAYPPFRLDMGGSEPAQLTMPPPQPPASPTSDAAGPAPEEPHAPVENKPGGSGSGWTGGRIAAVVVGSVMLLLGLGLLTAGTGALVVDRAARDDGFVTSPQRAFTSAAYAVVSERFAVNAAGVDRSLPEMVLGRARVRATDIGGDPVFVGVAATADVQRYLRGVPHTVFADIGDTGNPLSTDRSGVRAPAPPASQPMWVARSSGPGTQAVTWTPEDGDWTVVVMNSDRSAGVDVMADAAAELPGLKWLTFSLYGIAAVLLLAGGVSVALSMPRRGGDRS